MFSGLIIIVDLEGVEPSSKQGSHMLSTCLSLVQTRKPYAFYMLISAFGFRA